MHMHPEASARHARGPAIAPTWRGPRSGRLLLLVALLMPGLGLAPACATFRSTEPPEVFLVGLEPIPGGAMEQRFRIQLRVLNPNPDPLEVDGIDFTLDVNGQRLTRGLSGERVTIPRLGESVIPVIATTTLFDIFRQIVALSGRSESSYELRGRILRQGFAPSLRFERTGRFDGGLPGPAAGAP